jgi:hypothetical protein
MKMSMSSVRPTLSSGVLASACCLAVGGCGSSHAGAVIPHGARVIAMTSAAGLEPPTVRTTVTALDKVRQIAAWIDRMKPVPAGVAYSCPETAGIEPTVSLAFRSKVNGRMLAKASETDPGYGSSPCNPLTVTIPGEGTRALVAGMFLERIERLTGVDFGFGFGSITGTASYGGGARLQTGTRTPFPGGANAYLVNVYLANPKAFPGYGNGLLIGSSIDRRGQFSIRMAPGSYLLEAAKNGQKPDCPPTTAIVRVGHTTHANVLVGCRFQ